MERREFLKLMAVITAGFAVFGCRDFSLKEKKGLKNPSLSDFENEVNLACRQVRAGLDLVRVPMPGKWMGKNASTNRFGMAIDLDLCDSCGKCILACVVENNIALSSAEQAALGRFMHWIELRGGVPLMCFHCGDAPCEKVCPTGAANHTPDGISAMMYKRCAGSRFCGANCPVKARKFNFDDAIENGLSKKFNSRVPVREKGVMEKCTLCIHRLQDDRLRHKTLLHGEWDGRGITTACAEMCPKHAIIFGNWLDENSELVKVAKEKELLVPSSISKFDPSVVYMRRRR